MSYLGTPTVLFEAGHFPNDYQREETRKYVFIALLLSFQSIENNKVDNKKTEVYLSIPQNYPDFYDFVYKNVKVYYDNSEKYINFAAQYKEELIDGRIYFNAYIAKIDGLEANFGHIEIDGQNELFSNSLQNVPELDQKADFYLGTVKIENGAVVS